MTYQFVAHTDEPRTFSSKKSATKAAKRDLGKHNANNTNLLIDDFEVKEIDDTGRFGVLIRVGLAPDIAKAQVGAEVSGFIVESAEAAKVTVPMVGDEILTFDGENHYAGVVEAVGDGNNATNVSGTVSDITGSASFTDLPFAMESVDGEPSWSYYKTPEEKKHFGPPEIKARPALTPETATVMPKGSHNKGQVHVDPTGRLYECRNGSKQQAIIDALAKDCVFDHDIEIATLKEDIVGRTSKVGGATMDDLRAACVKKDGTPWDDNSVRSALYYDIKDKGYGIRTRGQGDDAHYVLVLPAGYDAPLPAKQPKS